MWRRSKKKRRAMRNNCEDQRRRDGPWENHVLILWSKLGLHSEQIRLSHDPWVFPWSHPKIGVPWGFIGHGSRVLILITHNVYLQFLTNFRPSMSIMTNFNHNTFSSLMVSNYFLKISFFLEIICLKSQNWKKLQGREKYKNWWKLKASCLNPVHLGIEDIIIYLFLIP